MTTITDPDIGTPGPAAATVPSPDENVVTLHQLDDGGYVIWGDGPAWPNDPANPRAHGSVWPGYAPHRGRVALLEAAAIARSVDGRLVIDGEVQL